MYKLNNEEMLYILEYTTSLINIEFFHDFCTKLLELRELFDFEYVSLGELKLKNHWTIKLDFTNYEKLSDIKTIVIAEKEIRYVNVLKGFFEGAGLVYWSERPEFLSSILSKENIENLCGYTGSKLSSNNLSASLLAFFGHNQMNSDKTEKYLTYLLPHLLATYERLSCKEEVGREELSERELDVLKWLKHGKTSWEVSKILEISENTVNFHIKNIKRKLNATNRQHAVAIAIANSILN
jgi:DNA-binding CsgD family transcriptional regulator